MRLVHLRGNLDFKRILTMCIPLWTLRNMFFNINCSADSNDSSCMRTKLAVRCIRMPRHKSVSTFMSPSIIFSLLEPPATHFLNHFRRVWKECASAFLHFHYSYRWDKCRLNSMNTTKMYSTKPNDIFFSFYNCYCNRKQVVERSCIKWLSQ